MSNGSPKRFPADLRTLGRTWRWKQALPDHLPAVEQVLAAGGPVAIIQDAGRRDWLPDAELLPRGTVHHSSWPTDLERYQALVVITDRRMPLLHSELRQRTILYHPLTLTLGISCFRGLPLEELSACVAEYFRQAGLAEESLTAVGIPARRGNEASLVDFTEDRALALLSYPPKALAVLANKGKRPAKMSGLCTPAALLAAGVTELAAPKRVFARVSLAIARRPWG